MAFNAANLEVAIDPGMFIQGVSNPAKYAFKYSTSDNLSDVETSDYFDSAGYVALRFGDYIGVTANDGKALYIVNTVSGATSSPSVSVFKIADIDTFRVDIW